MGPSNDGKRRNELELQMVNAGGLGSAFLSARPRSLLVYGEGIYRFWVSRTCEAWRWGAKLLP